MFASHDVREHLTLTKRGLLPGTCSNEQTCCAQSKPREQGTPKPCIPAERSNLQTHTWINFLLGLDTLNLESIFIAINIKVNIITL